MNCPEELRKRYRERRLIPFIGAGISMSVSWENSAAATVRGPSWQEVVEHAAGELGFMPVLARIRGTDLQILEYYKIKQQGNLARLKNWLVKRLDAPDDALRDSPIHKALAGMTHCDTFYTTNFDDFVERSFKLNGRPCKAVVVEAEMARDPAVCNIIKFHGDLDHPEQMVVSETQYEKRLRLADPLDHRFVGDTLGNALLFTGYSFLDPNVSYLFTLFAADRGGLPLTGGSGVRAYITAADPSDFERELFHERHIELIPVRAGHVTEDIALLLNQIQS
jgi:hypothetical protein